MREIKFRAWDKDRKCFFPCIVGNTDTNDDKWICPLTLGEVNGVKDWYNNDTCEVIQYTGLKDKNGKEIYEGDILAISIPNGEREQIVRVFFENGQFVISHYAINLLCERRLESEVIGNIYENPELLEGGATE